MRPRSGLLVRRRPLLLVLMAVAAFAPACDDDSRPGAAGDYRVRLALVETEAPLGALQFDVERLGQSGDWVGAGGGVDCLWVVDADLHACNDKRAGLLTCAVVDVDGFSATQDLCDCTFRSRDRVTASDFRVTVTDASTPGLVAAEATVAVTDVSEIASDSATTTLTD